jgi:tetratricopeptide (TPR) repeat protein
MQVRFAIGVLVLALAMGVSAPPLQAAPEAGLGRGAGVNFPTSCTPPAQARFNEALAGLHSFWYARAVKEFGDIAQSEPDCPIAYWGVALSLWNQLWAPPRQDALQKGSDAIQKAVALGAKSERERDYINAVAKFYADSDKLDHRTRARAYSDAMEKVYIKYPDDREAAAFYALSMLATIDPLDATYARQREAGKILEAIFREEPNHPAAAHYLIHAYDCGPLAERARPAAEQYAKSTPYVPHAIHMPSHTYVLLGMWKETIDTNMVAEKAEIDRGGPEDRLHDIDYLVYAYLQLGQDAKAKEAVERGLTIDRDLVAANRDVGLRSRPFTVAAGPARLILERSAWSEAAALPLKPDRFPYIEAIPHYARAIGAARSGHPDAAKAEIEKLTALQDALVKSKNQYWARQVELEAKIANAWTADAEGKPVDALAAMREAADLEGKSETHDTLSPGPIGFTAHEALGELLLKQGQPAEALAAFEESLQLAANRPRSYYGAALAAKQANDSDKAKIYVAKLADVCGVGSAADGAKLREAPSGLPCSALSQ